MFPITRRILIVLSLVILTPVATNALAGVDHVKGAKLIAKPHQEATAFAVGKVRVEVAGDATIAIRSNASIDGLRFRPAQTKFEIGGGGFGEAALVVQPKNRREVREALADGVVVDVHVRATFRGPADEREVLRKQFTSRE